MFCFIFKSMAHSVHHFYLFCSHMVFFFLINSLCLAFGFPFHLLIFFFCDSFFKDLGLFLFSITVLKLVLFFFFTSSCSLAVHVGKHPGTRPRITALFLMINDFVCMFTSSANGHSFLNSPFSPPLQQRLAICWKYDLRSFVCFFSVLFL